LSSSTPLRLRRMTRALPLALLGDVAGAFYAGLRTPHRLCFASRPGLRPKPLLRGGGGGACVLPRLLLPHPDDDLLVGQDDLARPRALLLHLVVETLGHRPMWAAMPDAKAGDASVVDVAGNPVGHSTPRDAERPNAEGRPAWWFHREATLVVA